MYHVVLVADIDEWARVDQLCRRHQKVLHLNTNPSGLARKAPWFRTVFPKREPQTSIFQQSFGFLISGSWFLVLGFLVSGVDLRRGVVLRLARDPPQLLKVVLHDPHLIEFRFQSARISWQRPVGRSAS